MLYAQLLLEWALRVVLVCAAGWMLQYACRRRSPVVRHAILVAVLATIVLSPALSRLVAYTKPISFPSTLLIGFDSGEDSLPIRLKHPPVFSSLTSSRLAFGAYGSFYVPSWLCMLLLVYGVGATLQLRRLILSIRRARNIVAGSSRVISDFATECLEKVAVKQGLGYPLPKLYVSQEFSVPFTIGASEPVIVLPQGWQQWSQFKLQAVMAHEVAHVRRKDWALFLIAGLVRCILWFVPPVWWLEKRLANLAEEICDAIAVQCVEDVRAYASIILEFAAVRSHPAAPALAMAQPSQAGTRIKRLLSEGASFSGTLSRSTMALIFLGAIPIVYTAAALQLAKMPATTRMVATEGSESEVPGATLTPTQAKGLEESLRRSPDSQDLHAQLMGYYFTTSMPHERARHLIWLIENHPESAALDTLPAVSEIFVEEKAHIVKLWIRQAEANPTEPVVLRRAGRFLQTAEPRQAAKWLRRARAISPSDQRVLQELVRFYRLQLAILEPPPTWARHHYEQQAIQLQTARALVAELSASQDAQLLACIGSSMASKASFMAMSIRPGSHVTPGNGGIEYFRVEFQASHAIQFLEKALEMEPGHSQWILSVSQAKRVQELLRQMTSDLAPGSRAIPLVDQ